ncbi:MAG: ester cyclase [Gemmatimonadales bacterium]
MLAAQVYFNAWNRRDPDAIIASFRPGGTYSDPSAGDNLTGAAIGQYAAGLFAAFPDLTFETGAMFRNGDDGLVACWTMRGTQMGPLRDLPATRATIALPGVDIIRVANGRVASVTGIFDRMALLEQLGLKVWARPERLGPVTFGAATHLESEDCTAPGAFSLTMIETRSEEESNAVVQDGRRILPEMARMEGFLGVLTASVGRRLYTITAWRDPDDARQLRAGHHAESVRKVFSGQIGAAGAFGLWVALHPAPMRVRCGGGGAWAREGKPGEACACGAALPIRPPAW